MTGCRARLGFNELEVGGVRAFTKREKCSKDVNGCTLKCWISFQNYSVIDRLTGVTLLFLGTRRLPE